MDTTNAAYGQRAHLALSGRAGATAWLRALPKVTGEVSCPGIVSTRIAADVQFPAMGDPAWSPPT